MPVVFTCTFVMVAWVIHFSAELQIGLGWVWSRARSHFVRTYKNLHFEAEVFKWRPVGDSNPCCRDENPVS